jgi:predicted aldo/keto reductase-like oxidoreductase
VFMSRSKEFKGMDRRKFIKFLLGVSVSSGLKLSAEALGFPPVQEQPSMTYRVLGRTLFKSSRLVFGGGAALVGGRAVRLLDRALEAGINHFDLGTNNYYRGSERSFAPFLKKNRDKVWVASKAPVPLRLKPDEAVSVTQAQTAAAGWTRLMEASLKELEVDSIDAYYLMAVNNPALVRCEEMHNAFLAAKRAGKVRFFGLSTHENAQKVLEAAIGTGWYDVAMIGITPVGWYDWERHDLVPGSQTLVELRKLLDRARAAGIGLIGMKTVRHLAPKAALGKGDLTAFDTVYEKKFLESPLNPFQRAYAYVLEHGLDVVNADMQNFTHLEENIVAAATSSRYLEVQTHERPRR